MKLRWLIMLAVLTGIVAFWGCGSSSTGPGQVGTELEGTWSDSDSLFQISFTFSGSNWTVLEEYWSDQDTTCTYTGTFVLNTTTTPKNIDLLCATSPDSSYNGLTALGIYALNSTATACTLALSDFGDTVGPSGFGTNPFVLTKQ